MEIAPLLFDLGTSKPTTTAGRRPGQGRRRRRPDRGRSAAPMPRATRKIRCRSALNPCKGMPFKWTLNPYRGCTHGCHYCYARRYHTQFELGADDEFASVIFVKTNVVEVLRRELQRAGWTHELVALGTATDCYQPIEGFYKLTRGVLEAFCEFSNPTGVVTKGPMIVRDKDVLVDLSAKTDVQRLHQRAVRGRRRVARARARHRASASTAARGTGARRRWSQGRRPHEPDRSRHLVEAGADRAHGEGDCRSRRPLHRVAMSCTSRRARATTSCDGWRGIPAPGRRLPAALRRQVPAQGVSRRGEDCRRNDDDRSTSRQ